MVHIINGEIVPDDDPRVRARQQPPPLQTPRRFGSVHNEAASGSPAAQGARPGAGTSPFQNLARHVGLEGSVTLPAILGLPARPVQKIHLVMAALLTAFFGWRALALLAFVVFLMTRPPPPRQ